MALVGHNVFRRNVVWQFVGSGSQMALGLLVLAVMARGLGPAGFGTFSIVTSLVLVGNYFFEPRMQDVVAKQLWELHGGTTATDGHCRTLGDLILIEGVGKLLPLAGLILLSPVLQHYSQLPPGGAQLIVIAAAGLYVAKLGYGVTVGLLRVVGRSDLLAYCAAGETLLRLMLLSALYFTHRLDVTWAIIVPCITGPIGMACQWGCASSVAVAFRRVRNLWGWRGVNMRTRASRRLLLSSLGLSITDLINKDLDITIISSFTPAASIGIYKLAKSLAMLAWKVIDPFTLALMPEISRLVSLGECQRVRRVVRRSAAGLFAVALLLALGIFATLLLFGSHIFGQAFARLPTLLPWMLTGVVLSAALVWGHPLAVALNRADLSLAGTTIGSVFGITALILLAPHYGIVAVGMIWAAGLLTSFLFLGLTSLAALRRRNAS